RSDRDWSSDVCSSDLPAAAHRRPNSSVNIRSASFDWQYAFHGPYDLSHCRSSKLIFFVPILPAPLDTVVTLGNTARCKTGINSRSEERRVGKECRAGR